MIVTINWHSKVKKHWTQASGIALWTKSRCTQWAHEVFHKMFARQLKCPLLTHLALNWQLASLACQVSNIANFDWLDGFSSLKLRLRTVLVACIHNPCLGLPTKKSKVLWFQICFTRTKNLSEIYKNQTIKLDAAKLFSVNSSWTWKC